MNLDEALAADRRGDLLLAIDGYEAAVQRGEASLETLMNLAVLYWQIAEPGVSAANALGPDAIEHAFRRSREVVEYAERRFPANAEPRFWRCYFAWADLGEPLDPDMCRTLLREDRTTMVPAFHLFALSQGKECEQEAFELLRRFNADPTAKGRYVSSVIDGVLRRRACKPR